MSADPEHWPVLRDLLLEQGLSDLDSPFLLQCLDVLVHGFRSSLDESYLVYATYGLMWSRFRSDLKGLDSIWEAALHEDMDRTDAIKMRSGYGMKPPYWLFRPLLQTSTKQPRGQADETAPDSKP